jgi:hypothetical protein
MFILLDVRGWRKTTVWREITSELDYVGRRGDMVIAVRKRVLRQGHVSRNMQTWERNIV